MVDALTERRQSSSNKFLFVDVDADEVHSGALRAFELSTGLGFTEQMTTLHGSDSMKRRAHYESHKPSYTNPEDSLKPIQLSNEPVLHKKHGSWTSLFINIKEISFLILLYTIQGIPMGLSASIPFLLQGYVHYSDLGLFSLVSLPFSCKVFWAPIVDSLYFPSVGRRKSWLIPVQLICGIMMFVGGLNSTVDNWMGYADNKTSTLKPNVPYLLIYFSFLYFLMATQDVAVDGWSLTMLNEENRAFSSSCNAIGQTLGFSIAHVGFLALRDPKTCNRWLRYAPSEVGIVTLGSFLRFWSFIVIGATILACYFPEKPEETHTKHVSDAEDSQDTTAIITELDLDVQGTYRLLFQLATVKPVLQLASVLLLCRFAFAPIDAATHLKLIESGMTKEELAFFGPFLLPLGIICPLIIGKLTCGPRPLKWFVRGWIFRFLMSFIWLGFIYLTKLIYTDLSEGATPAFWFYGLLIIVSILHSASTDIMFSAQMAFFARVADPAIGGTYMTLLNTLTNMGNKWPTTLSLMTLDHFESVGDGFVLQTILFSVLGLLWLFWSLSSIWKLERAKREDWLVIKQKSL